jgi:hypothetical protein
MYSAHTSWANDTVTKANKVSAAAHFDNFKESFTKADADVDFGQFDNDGPDGSPNSGDDDGYVDTVLLVQPEIGGECRKAAALKNIWSHSRITAKEWATTILSRRTMTPTALTRYGLLSRMRRT